MLRGCAKAVVTLVAGFTLVMFVCIVLSDRDEPRFSTRQRIFIRDVTHSVDTSYLFRDTQSTSTELHVYLHDKTWGNPNDTRLLALSVKRLVGFYKLSSVPVRIKYGDRSLFYIAYSDSGVAFYDRYDTSRSRHRADQMRVKQLRREQAESMAEFRKNLPKLRAEFAYELEMLFLNEAKVDTKITVSGKKNEILNFECIFVDRVFANELMKNDEFITGLRLLEFEKIVLTDGFGYQISYTL